MSLKSPARTAQRIIAMVESGDYDPLIIEHMVESVVKNRDRRIKELENRSKPRTFDMTIKRISGALRDTIKEHGDITPNFIASAAKRIYGKCQQVENTVEPVAPAGERLENGNVTVVRDKTSTHKLTVARDGNIRIKIAIDAEIDESNQIIEGFIKVAVEAINLNKGTLRGKLKLNEIYNPHCTGITLYNDNKSEQFNLNF